MDNFRRDVCNRWRDPLIDLNTASPHAHDPATHRRRLRGPLRSYGDVTEMAKGREQSRQSLYREAEQVTDAVEGSAGQARRRPTPAATADHGGGEPGPSRAAQARRRDPPEKQHDSTTVAHAEGVSLGVARRLWRVVEGPEATQGVPTLGRATLQAGPRAGVSSGCSTRRPGPRPNKPPPMRIFRTPTGPEGRRAREPLPDHRPDRPGPRRGHLGRGIRPAAPAQGGGPRRRYRPGQGGEAAITHVVATSGLPEFDHTLEVFPTPREGDGP